MTSLTRRIDYIGYNFVDYNYYTELPLCNEGKIYDSSLLICKSK